MTDSKQEWPEYYFQRYDPSPDRIFYQPPRLVVHIDPPALVALQQFYGGLLPETGDVLDLMSSHVSHLPPDARYNRVIGLGMNATELAANGQLSGAVVHDLNKQPTLPFTDTCFDGCLISVSVQYLTQPIKVFSEISRVLRPGGVCAVTFSNRCFPTKAVALWLNSSDQQHGGIVSAYFETSGGFSDIDFLDLSPMPGQSDPLYAVVARKAAGNVDNTAGDA